MKCHAFHEHPRSLASPAIGVSPRGSENSPPLPPPLSRASFLRESWEKSRSEERDGGRENPRLAEEVEVFWS